MKLPSKDTVIYIAGPITGHEDYLEKFKLGELLWRFKGYRVINPAEVNKPIGNDLEYEDFMDICFLLIEKSDAVFFLNG